MIAPALAKAYLATHYAVDVPDVGRCVLRVGESSGDTCPQLVAAGARRWAIIAAANPRSAALPDAENRLRHLRLLDAVARAGWTAWPGENLAPAGDWPPESTLFIPDIPLIAAIDLAAAFEQHALLVADAEGVARLCWCAQTIPSARSRAIASAS